MSYSLNETEALSKRAARGAKLDWGVAEEAAKATRWLCAYGFDGCRSLDLALAAHASAAFSPSSFDGEWTADSGVLCSILTGASLMDCAHDIANTGVSLHNASSPLMLLPFLASVARETHSCLSITWSGVIFVTDGNTVSFNPHDDAAAYAKRTDRVVIERAELLGECTVITSRATPDPKNWERLSSLAALTYAPATDLSRRLGAGAEKTDND